MKKLNTFKMLYIWAAFVMQVYTQIYIYVQVHMASLDIMF